MALSCAVGLLLTGCSNDEVAGVVAEQSDISPPAADESSAPPSATEEPAPPTRAVLLGDSCTAASVDGGGYVPPTAEGMGWTPVLQAVGGTGYLAPAPGSGPYGSRVDEVVAGDPDVVVVQGSTNDVGYPVADVATAARELYAALAGRLPDAEVVVVGPLDPPGVDPAGVDAIRAVLAEEAGAAGLPFVDPVAGDWLGTGEGLYADPVHPNEAGYGEFATDLVGALQSAGL